MKTATDRFFKCNVVKCFEINGERFDTPYMRYSYESATALYDVDVRLSDGDKTYHINCGFNVPKQRHHVAIEKHFGI